MWPTPSSTSAALVSPASGLTKSAARASRSAHAGALPEPRRPAAPARARGPTVARVCFLGLNGRYRSSSRLVLSAASISAASSGVSLPCDSIERRIVCLRSASSRSLTSRDSICADLLFVQPAGLVLAVAGDERDGVAGVEQLDDALDLAQRELQRLRHRSQIDGDRVC